MCQPSTNDYHINMPSKGILKQRTMEESLSESSRRRRSPKRSCSFDVVEIREHEIILDTSDDILAALTVSWKSVSTEITTVIDFEIERCPRRGKVRSLEREERISLLLRAGYKLDDICIAKSPKSPTKSKTKSSKSKSSRSEKTTKTVLKRMRTAAKKMVKHNDSACMALYNTAA